MTKSTITKTWIGGLIAIALGLITVGISVGLMLAYGGQFTPAQSGNGYDFVPRLDGFFWTMVSLMIAGCAAAAVGGLVQLVAWVGALINTYRLEDRTWFVVLLVGGLVGLVFALVGFAAMVAYLIAGPDGMAVERPPLPSATPRPSALAPTA